MRDAFLASLLQCAERDPRIVLLTGDLGFKVLDPFAARLPAQFINAGVAEQNMTAMAAGIALTGRIAVTYSIANFPTLRCLEQIRNDAAYHDADVKVVAVGGGFSYGALGISHHATEDLAVLRAMPGVTVLAPGDDSEAAAATEAMLSHRGTCYLRIDRAGAPAQAGGPGFQIGKARRLREGRDLTLVACGGILAEAVAAADLLAKRGVECRVVSMHTIRPLDHAELECAALETGGIVTVEEHTVYGGLGGAVAEHLLEAGRPPRRFLRIGLPGVFSSIVGSQDYLRRAYRMDAAAIAERSLALLA